MSGLLYLLDPIIYMLGLLAVTWSISAAWAWLAKTAPRWAALDPARALARMRRS